MSAFCPSGHCENNREFAGQIAVVLKDVCQRGYADQATILSDLTSLERQQFQELLAPPLIARDFARRIEEATGFHSPAVAAAVQNDLEAASDAGKVTSADVVAVVGAKNLPGSSGLPTVAPFFDFFVLTRNEPGDRLDAVIR